MKKFIAKQKIDRARGYMEPDMHQSIFSKYSTVCRYSYHAYYI